MVVVYSVYSMYTPYCIMGTRIVHYNQCTPNPHGVQCMVVIVYTYILLYTIVYKYIINI